MNRTMVSGIAVFALLIGAGHAMNATTADAGLFSKHRAKRACGAASHCGGGGECYAPAAEPCCAPAPAPEPCCAPAPAPEPCCAPAPEPCCDSGPTCGHRRHGCRRRARRSAGCCSAPAETCCSAPAVEAAPCCGAEMSVDAAGYDLAPGETLVPGSVEETGAPAAPESSSDAVEGVEAEVPPPAPVPDASTDA